MNRAPDTRRQRNRRRLVFVVATALVVVGSLFARPAEPLAASAGDEATFVAELNRVRADHGLPALIVNSELSNLARGHAQVMADAGEIFHASPISAGYSGPWSKFGENVGVGANVSVLVDAFVDSPGHYANIIDPAFTEIGVGVIYNGPALYTTHRFLQVPGSTPPTTSPPPPPSTTAPPAPTTSAPTTSAPTTSAPPVAPTTTTTTLAPLAAPAISVDRVLALLEMLDAVGT